MENVNVRSVDRVDCIVGWDPRASFAAKEYFSVPRLIYDVMVHKNIRAYLRGDSPLQHSVETNIVTLEGKDRLNDVMFHGTAQINPWYVVIFNSNTTCVNTMTYEVPVYTEHTAYSEAAAGRPIYDEAASAAQVTTNTSTRAVFTITGDPAYIYGCALVGGTNALTSNNKTAGAANCLYSASKFTDAKSVIATNVLSIGISISQT